MNTTKPNTTNAGFTLIELMLVVGIMAVLGAVAALGVRGFATASTSAQCRSDTLRLRKAETTYFVVHDDYADEDDLVSAGLLDSPSDLHDVGIVGGAYTITEVGPCIGQGSAYGIAAPSVGTSAHSGTTVSVLASGGHGVPGVAASFAPAGQSTWTAIGTTDAQGSASASMPDGVYDIRIAYDGAVNTLSQVSVTSGTVVTFPALPLTVRLRDGGADGLAGGNVLIQAPGGAQVALGSTPASGDLVTDVLPGAYDVTVTYGSMSSTRTGIAVTGPTVVAFEMCTSLIRLRAVSGAGLAGGVVNATPTAGGSVLALGTTDASGTVSAMLLSGTYDISVRYAGVLSVQTVAISGTPTVTFQFVTVTVRMAQSDGTRLTGADAATWYRPVGAGGFTALGVPDSSGNTTVDLLPATYDFEARWFGMTMVRSAVAITGAGTVLLQTSPVTLRLAASSGAGLSGQDSALFMRSSIVAPWVLAGAPDGNGSVRVELFPGAYDFEARWYGATLVQTGVVVSPNSTVTFTTVPVTFRLLASTGAGLTGQDGAFYFRQSGTGPYYLAGSPDASGTATFEVLPAVYDFESRWFAVMAGPNGVTVSAGAPPTITFHTVPVTLRLLASTGAGLSGQDGALFVRTIATSAWSLSGAPDASGTLVQELFPSVYDVEARWFGATVVQSSVIVNAPITVTFQTKLATLRLLSSTGTGLAGQDQSLWVRPSGTTPWLQTDPPVGGTVAQELFAGSYDVRARWVGVFAQQSSVAVNAPVTVTFTSVPVTLRMLTSTGSGLTGQDEAMWVRPSGTTPYFFLGAPPANGVLVQELFAASYDVRFRWTGTFNTLASNAVSGPTTLTISAVPVVETCRRQSDGTAASGATGSVVNGALTYPFGLSNASGLVNMQVFAGAHDFRCKLGSLQGTNTNVSIPAGGGATTVNMA